MNSYNLVFGSPVWIMILLMLGATVFTVLIYRRTNPAIPTGKKSILTALRLTALLALIFFIFEPVLTRKTGVEKPPVLRVLADNSLSTAVTDNAGDRAALYRSAVEKSGIENGEEGISVYSFGDGIRKINDFTFDSLSLDERLTDISGAIETAGFGKREENVRAALLITDGRYTKGINPVYAAEKFGLPIYVLALGDSTPPKDIILKKVLSNEVAYVGSPVPANLKIDIAGYPDDSITVKLYDNGKYIDSKIITTGDKQISYSLLFDYTPPAPGTRKITASVEYREGELTGENNSASAYVKVLDKKRKIAVFGGAPNPDIAFIKKYLSEDRDIEVMEFIQKKEGMFYVEPSDQLLKEARLFIFSDFPNEHTPDNIIRKIKNELERNKPLLFIAGYNVNYRKLQALEEYLPFNTLKTGKREFEATPFLDAHSLNSALINISGSDRDLNIWNSLPPIYKTETFVRVKPESRLVAGVKVNGVDVGQPLILERYFRGNKSIAVLGYGIYRWKLTGKAAEVASGDFDSPDVFEAFLGNSLKRLSVSEGTKRFIVKTLKKQYTLSEEVEFTGELYDAAFTPIDNAAIKIAIAGEEYSGTVTMQGLGNGRYSAKIDGLPKGDYKFTARATKESRNLGTEKDVFNVGDISPEYFDITMNSKLLRRIAEQSGGQFFTADRADKILDIIEGHHDFKSYSYSVNNEMNLWNKWELLLLAIVCFGVEWFFRKRFGLL